MPRFALLICMTFATAFVGVFWAKRGFPTQVARPSPVGELQPTLTTEFGEKGAADLERRQNDIRAEAQMQPGNPELAAIRRDLLQAGNAYQLSPCDKTIRQNLVVALTAYTRAWRAKLDCRVLMFCNDKNLRAVQVAFSTPLDERIKETLDLAFEQRGILKTDFPSDVRSDMLQFTGSNFWGDSENAVCLPRLRAGITER